MRPDVARRSTGSRRPRATTASRSDHVGAIAPTPSRRGSSRSIPDPRWVAPPGHSLHRLGTELDLGPAAPPTAGWRGTRRDFTSSGATPGSPGTSATAEPALDARRLARSGRAGDGRSAVPSFVPAAYARADRARGEPLERVGARCSPRSSTRSPTSTRSPSAARARGASPSSCRAPRAPTASPTRSTPSRRDRRPGPPDARPAAPVRLGLAGARRLQRGPGPVERCGCVRRSPRRRPTSPGSSA